MPLPFLLGYNQSMISPHAYDNLNMRIRDIIEEACDSLRKEDMLEEIQVIEELASDLVKLLDIVRSPYNKIRPIEAKQLVDLIEKYSI